MNIKNRIKGVIFDLIPMWMIKGSLPRKMSFYGHIISDENLIMRHKYRYPSFKEMDEFIDLFRKIGYEFVSYENYIKEDGKKKILLTFDDGWKEVHTRLHPYMMKKKVPYMIFILGYPFHDPYFMIDVFEKFKEQRKAYFLDTQEIRKLKTDGVSIGFHTINHFNINNTITPDDQKFLKEIIIEDQYRDMFSDPLAFAYPFSSPKEYARYDDVLRKRGFKNIFDTRWWHEDSGNHFFRLPMDIDNKGGIMCRNPILYNVKKVLVKKYFKSYKGAWE